MEKYLIDARKVKNILVNKSRFSDWVKRNIKNNKLIEEKDFFIKKEEIKLHKSKVTKINYFFTPESAQKIIFRYSKNKIAQQIKEKLENGIELKYIFEPINYKKEIKIIKYDDDEFPTTLKKIKNAPKQLYVIGNLGNLKENGIAVIGSRNCSNYGRTICKIFTNNLVGYNLNIISGLAVGIDTCAHKTCLEAKGKTIAVLTSGFNHIFPKENEELLNRILENGGTIVTEYPPEFEKTQESCRQRNRIMSGLAIGTLVVEAEKRSGTSITVGYTNEQNKKAFCVPSSLLNSKGVGTNQMIKENKAKLVTEVEDIIKEYPELKLERKTNFNFVRLEDKKKIKKKEEPSKVNLQIEEENLEIYNCLSKKPKAIDEIAAELNKPINEIAYKLTLLDLQGAIEELPGKKFKIK